MNCIEQCENIVILVTIVGFAAGFLVCYIFYGGR